jgi:DNA-directed RNA polymerase specialized sigma24 family protein
VSAQSYHDSVRDGLVALLPRLKRFASVLVGDKDEGTALLRRALLRMLDDQHRYQRGTPLDRWAFGEIYRLWLYELRDHADPMREGKASEASFERLFHQDKGADFDALTASFLGHLPPQQRSTLLLVYGEGFGYEDAGRVLDASPDTIAARLIRASATLADRLGAAAHRPRRATIETLYPAGQEGQHDRAQ